MYGYDMDDLGGCCCGYGHGYAPMEPAKSTRGFEFCDDLQERADTWRRDHPEHADKLAGNGLIIFPGEAPWLPGAY